MPTSACRVSDVRDNLVLTCPVFGGIGFNTEMPMEKLYRDAKIFELCTSARRHVYSTGVSGFRPSTC